MRFYFLLLTTAISFLTASAQTTQSKSKVTAAPTLKNALDSFSYAIGLSTGNFCNQQKIAKLNTSMLLKGMTDAGSAGKALLTEQQMNTVISSYLSTRNTQNATANKQAGEKFLAANAKKQGVVTLASGLQYQVLNTGSDTTRPKLTDKVKCHYHGTLIDGTVFDSSVERGEPVEFPVNGVIQGWVEALQLMPVGSKWRLFIPSDLAYGDSGAGPTIGPGSTLIFDVELLEIVK
ncbi:MAG TPA: FKBP-type peptidyl-prolyl cis-trans isomerase [Chitinophagaceae bacterium]|nr:FKBP-type peptidyl-prolyl cis-trans isomerase [Chitinophagaceae bacterium]